MSMAQSPHVRGGFTHFTVAPASSVPSGMKFWINLWDLELASRSWGLSLHLHRSNRLMRWWAAYSNCLSFDCGLLMSARGIAFGTRCDTTLHIDVAQGNVCWSLYAILKFLNDVNCFQLVAVYSYHFEISGWANRFEKQLLVSCSDCYFSSPLGGFIEVGFGFSMFPPSCNLVDPASSHMLVSKIKPCMSQYKCFTAKLRMAH